MDPLETILLPTPAAPAPEATPALCKPALSRSLSSHDNIDANKMSISNRLESARGVVRNCNKMFVTNRLSTLLSGDDFRSLRRASVRCSLRMTANQRRSANERTSTKGPYLHV